MACDTEPTPHKKNHLSQWIFPLILIIVLPSVILFFGLLGFQLQQPEGMMYAGYESNNSLQRTNTPVITGPPSNTIRSIWNYAAPTKKKVSSVAVSEDGRYVVAGAGNDLCYFNREGTLLWNYTGWNEYGTYKGTFSALSISDDGRYIIGSLGYTFYYFAQNGTRLWKEEGGFGADSIRNVAASNNGNFFSIGTSLNHVRYYNSESAKPVWSFTTFIRQNTSESNAGNHVALSADGQYVAASGEDSRVYYLNQSGALLWQSSETGRPLEDITMSADGHTITAASRDHNIYVFDNSGKLLWNATTGNVVRTIAMSSDGKYIVAGSDDSVITFFNHNGTLLSTYSARMPVTSLAISRNGNTIAAASKDSGIYCFERAGTLLWMYTARNAVNSVAVSGDGQYIVAGSPDGNVYFFNRNGTEEES
jgi:WD40 repeat protein